MTSRTFDEIKADVIHAISINDAELLLNHAAELDALNTPQAMAEASASRGPALCLRGDYPTALSHFRRALALYEELGDRSGVATVMGNMGNVHMHTGDYPSAESLFQRSLALHEELGDRRGIASVTGNIGILFHRMGDYPAALSHYHRSLALSEELGDRSGVARATGNIGNVHRETGDYPAALECYHRVLALHEEVGDRRGVAISMSNIGNVYRYTGNYPEAMIHNHRALALHQEIGDQIGVARVTVNIGIVHGSTGDYAAALSQFQRALTLYEELGDRSGVASDLSNIGITFLRLGDYPAALSHFHRARILHEELGERSAVPRVTGNILSAHVNMHSDTEAALLLAAFDGMHIDEPEIRITREHLRATLLERSGDIDGAALTLQHAMREALDHGLRSKAAEVHMALRDLALKQNDLAGYVEHNNEFTRITEEINGKETTLKLAMQAKQREIDAERRETEKYMAVLHSTLPKHIADRVARGEVVNDHYDNAAVIFLDIVGFTSISDRIPSGHVVHLLEQIFTTLDAVCKRNNVIKIKTIGDSYMAVSFESVANAALCALDMIASLDALEITMPSALGDTSWTKEIGDIKVRIGMHCGPLTAGVIGTERMQYDVWGDTVNVASRMESTSEPGRIHVSSSFAASLSSPPDPLSHAALERGSLALVPRGEIDVKGKGTMQTYWLE